MNIKVLTVLSGILFIFSACNRAQQDKLKSTPAVNESEELNAGHEFFISLEGDTIYAVMKTEAQWQTELSDLEYKVLRKAGTERAFTGALWDNKKKGIYTCKACGLPLFDSETKFKSGTGWPSYYQPIKQGNVKENIDNSYGMSRVEVVCARCEGHLGHIFEDGPKPTGLRYCINSVSLNFVEQ